MLKLNAWEPSFTEHILNIREKELKILKQYALVYSGTSFVWLCAPFLVSYNSYFQHKCRTIFRSFPKVSIVTFVTYIYTGDDHILTAEKAFVCLTLFDIIKLPLSMLPLTIAQMTQVMNVYSNFSGPLNSHTKADILLVENHKLIRLGKSFNQSHQ